MRHAPHTLRNREPILGVLQRVLAARSGVLLEIASGSGEHAAFIAPRLEAEMIWQPSDADESALADIDAHAAEAHCARIRPAIHLDVCASAWPIAEAGAVLCCNMIHIAPWSAAEGLFAGAARLLAANAPLILYGPYRRNGQHTAPSNEEFDASLKSRDPRWGVRCLETEVVPLARANGFVLEEAVVMPANNAMPVFRKT